jgi:predicted dehydrogenase
MAHTMETSVDLVRRAEQSSGSLHVAHVLRYTPFFRRLHALLPEVGEIVTVEHRENVVAWHMAHSFVRGNWSKAAEATPMIVQKCCHDFDILAWNIPSPVTRLVSFGSLVEFRAERAPAGATERCLDCPVVDCPYDARPVYLDPARTGWPVSVITDDRSAAGRRQALRHGPYGRCAYRAGSDVVDNQVVAMQLANGGTATLTMHGHSHEEARTMRYDGTRATVRGVFGARQHLEIADHRSGRVSQVDIPRPVGGHGGGDHGIMESFVEAVTSGRPGPPEAASSLESHLLAFAAEHSRVTGETIDMGDLRSR